MTSWFLKKEEETHDTRALVASKLAILAPPKHKKKTHAAVELNLFFLASLLQCTSIYGCAL